jgi:enoyl-CoA hydratase/carnithine racemase
MSSGLPVLQVSGALARVSLCRPAHKNRLQPEDLSALREIFDELASNRTVRVVVLQSSGDVFSAGFDLNQLAAGNVGNAQDGPGGFGAMVDMIEALPQPVIARLQGGVYGGATDMALACDFRIGVTSMAAQMPAAAIGLHYYKSGILRFASRLGLDNAKRMFLTAERLDGPELLRIGFLTALVEPDALDEAVTALAAKLAANAPLAVQGVKLALNELAANKWNDEIFTRRAEFALQSRDLREGIAAVREKRSAVYENV